MTVTLHLETRRFYCDRLDVPGTRSASRSLAVLRRISGELSASTTQSEPSAWRWG